MVTKQNQGQCALNIQLEINGKTVVSDEEFKCVERPDYFSSHMTSLDPMAGRISAWGGYKENYDTRLYLDGWNSIDFDDSKWQNAVKTCDLGDVLILPRQIKPLVEYNLPKPKAIEFQLNTGTVEKTNGKFIFDCSKSGSLPSVLFDFGKEVVGYPSFTVKGGSGSFVEISYGEGLEVTRIDSFVLNGKEQIVAPFSRRAFRYVKVTFGGSDTPCYLESINMVQTHYPLNAKCKFSCEKGDLLDIFNVSLYTTTLATQHHFEDSVYREQMQWLLDARIMALVIYYCFDNTEICEKAIRQFVYTQLDSGAIEGAGPQKSGQLLPDYCMHFVMMVEEWITLGGGIVDEQILTCLEKLMAYFSKAEGEDGLISIEGKDGWWCFLDWANIDKRGIVTGLNCVYKQCIDSYCKILESANKDASYYARKSTVLKNAINKKLFNKQNGLYCDCSVNDEKSDKYSQQSNVYAIISGVAENPLEIIDKIFNDNFYGTKINGSFMMCLTVDMLFQYGKQDLSLKLIDGYWGEMLRRGATTWWETFDMNSPKSSVPHSFSSNNATYMHDYIPVSFCHAWGAGVAYALVKAGIVK